MPSDFFIIVAETGQELSLWGNKYECAATNFHYTYYHANCHSFGNKFGTCLQAPSAPCPEIPRG